MITKIQCPTAVNTAKLRADITAVDPTAVVYVLSGGVAQIAHDDNEVDYAAIVAAHDGTAYNLEQLREQALGIIDRAAEKLRRKIVNVDAAMGTIYKMKDEEAKAYHAAADPADLAPYPLIQAEVDAGEGEKTASECCDIIRGNAAAWKQVVAAEEREKVRFKNRVRAATTEAGIITARETGVATLQTIEDMI